VEVDHRQRDLGALIVTMELAVDALALALSEPFVSAKGATTAVRHVGVRISWDGVVGHGVAVPAREYGTTDGTVRAALADFAPILAEHTPFELERVLRRLEAAVPGQAAAVAAVDLALHDLLGQIAGLPIHRLLGLDGLAIPPTALSLGVMPVAASVERARALAAWPILKLKMQRPDEALVARVREVYPGRLWIDGNGGWTAKEAVIAAERFVRHGVELLEQPVPPGAPGALRFVRERAPMTIVADEDCVRPADVLALAGCADAINIKLLKCGGLRRAIEMIGLARRAGLRVMLGCKTESVLGTTAIAQLGGLADFLDVDGHLDIVDDPYEGILVENGRVILPSRPGLGARLRS
jgi:L-alanine-DL-glutamate epimerase-like enolase superfamily enzyme